MSINGPDDHDPALFALQVVRTDIADMRREWREDIKSLRAEMVTQAQYAATEQGHAQAHKALQDDIEQLRQPARWPAVLSSIASVLAVAIALAALLA